MKIISPKSLADVKWILQHWKTTKLRLPDRFEGWHYKPGMTEEEQLALVDLAITHQYPIPADFSYSLSSAEQRQDAAPEAQRLGWDKVFRKFDGKFRALAHIAADRCYPESP